MVECSRAQQPALPFSSGSQVRPLRAAPIYERKKVSDSHEQTIVVYNTLSDEGDRCLYEGKVGDMSDEIRSRLRVASFYLLSDAEEYDIIAII